MKIVNRWIDNRLAVILVILAGSVILRLPYTDKPLMKDEGRLFKMADIGWTQIPEFIIHNEAHPPFYYYMIKLWAKFYSSFFWLRLLSVIFGSLTVVVLYLMALRLYGRKIGLLAVYITALSPNLIYISQMLRGYSAATFFTACAILCFIVYYERKDSLSLVFYTIFALASIYTFYLSIFLIIGMGIFPFLSIKKFRAADIARFVTTNIIIGLLFLPWVPSMLEQLNNAVEGSGSHEKMIIAQRFGFYVGKMHIGQMIRGLSGIFHMDHALFSNIRLHMRFDNIVLLTFSTAILAALCFIVVKGSKYLSENEKMRGATTLVLLLIFLPFFLAAMLNVTKGFVVIQRYMGPCAVLSSLIISGFILSFRGKVVKIALTALMTAFFILRIVTVWGYHDKEYKFLDAFILKEKDADVIVSREPDFFRDKKAYGGMRIIAFSQKDTALTKGELQGSPSFYLVEFDRPINLIKGRAYYETAKARLVQDYELVKAKAIDDVVSVELYKKR